MAFSEQVVEQAWRRSGGRCECPRVSDGHPNPHGKRLDKANRGRTGEGCWEAHHIVAGEPRDLVVAQDLEVETPEIEVFLSCLRDEGYIYRTWADNDEEQYIPRVTAVGTGQGGGNVGLAMPLPHLADDPVGAISVPAVPHRFYAEHDDAARQGTETTRRPPGQGLG